METETEGDGTLGRTVYRKPTQTDRYLNSRSNHHPSQKRGVIKTLAERTRRIYNPSDLKKKIKNLKRAFGWNRYSI